jgi:hypothetical protein
MVISANLAELLTKYWMLPSAAIHSASKQQDSLYRHRGTSIQMDPAYPSEN